MQQYNGLTIENIKFSYKTGQNVLHNINAHFESGKITALLGNNGSGKTTLLKILSYIFTPQSGQVFLRGKPINRENLLNYKKLVGFMPELLQLYPEMRVIDALNFLAHLKECERHTVMETLEKVDLCSQAKVKIKRLSKGMKQRLNLAQAIVNSPQMVILDEPSNGLDYSGMIRFYGILRQLADEGAMVLISTHQLTEVLAHVDKIIILSHGKIVKQGSTEQLIKSSQLANVQLTMQAFEQLLETIK